MTTNISFIDATETQKSVVTECNEPLHIHPNFERLCCPPMVDRTANGPMGKLSYAPEDIQERKTLRKEFLKEELKKTGILNPFIVWRHQDKLLIVDGRHDEYDAACELKLPIQMIEFKFDSLEEATIFVSQHCLNKPHLNPAHRMLMVRHLKSTVQKLAKANQGKRNDMLPESKKQSKRVHTNKILAALAQVGEQTYRRFCSIIDDGPKYLGEKKTQEFLEMILADKKSVHQVHNNLKEAKSKKKETKKFTTDNPDIFPEAEDNKKASKKHSSDETVYENPSYSEDFHNKIICGDRMEVVKNLPDECCNLIMMSTEYNVNRIKYDVDVPILPYYEFLNKLNNLWTECSRILRDGGRLAINIPALVSVFEDSSTRPFNTPLFMDIIREIEKLDIGLNLREVLVWHKLNPIRKHHLSAASPKNPCYRADHEFVILFSKNQWEMTPENENAPSDLTAEMYKENCSSVISVAPQSKGFANHPAVYPELLCEKIIPVHSFVGDTVIDLSNGTGTTTAVAARMGRRHFGCDLSAKYCKAANERTQRAYKQYMENVLQSKEKPVNKAA